MEQEHRTIIRANSQEQVLKLRATTYINNLNTDGGKEYEVIVKPYKSKRSLEQNAYYWGVIINYASKELGYHKREAHETLKAHLLPVVANRLVPAYKDSQGKSWPEHEVPIHKSTRALNTKEMGEYIDSCIIVLSEFGVEVPSPEYRYL